MTKGLDQLDVLVGEWTSSSKKYPEGRGRMTVAPVEGGRFLRIDSRIEDELFPVSAQARGVWKVWREAARFNQRFTGQIRDGGRTIEGQWEFSEDGKSWEVDFDRTYIKVG